MASDLVEAFSRAGWPRKYLMQDYAPSPKSTRRVDLAIVIPPHRWLLAVEARTSLAPATLDRRLRELAGIWFAVAPDSVPEIECLTDGRTFALQTGAGSPGGWNTVVLDGVPTPQYFGIEPEKQSLQIANLVELHSLAQLQTLIRDRRIDAIVVDQTLPFGPGSALRVGSGRERSAARGLDPAEQAIALAVQNGVRIVSAIVTPATLASPAKRKFRALLAGQTQIGGIVELPRGLLGDSSLSAVWLCCAPNRSTTYFGKLTTVPDLSDFLTGTWPHDFIGWLQGGKAPAQGFTTQLDATDQWTSSAQHPSHKIRVERLPRLVPQLRLSDVCEVFTGAVGSGTPGGDVPLIKGGCLVDGYVDLARAETIKPSLKSGDRSWAQPGDVLLSRAYHGRSNIAVFAGPQTAIISSNVVCLRPVSDKVSPEALREFFSSSAGEGMLEHTVSGAYIPHISLASLRTTPVPSLDPDVLSDLDEAHHLEDELRQSAADLLARRRQLFDADSLPQFRENLGELRRMSRVIRASVISAERLDYVISNFYPYPLAYGFRMLSSVGEPSQRYAVACQVSENMIAFLASITMSLLDGADRSRTNLGLATVLRSGISPGHWREFCRRANVALVSYEGNPLAIALSRLEIGSNERPFGAASGLLIEEINRYKHRRPNSLEEIAEVTDVIETKLRYCFDQLSFLTDYPIRLVDRCDQLRSGRFLADCQRYVGDHPGHARERIELNSARVAGDLYVEIRPTEWVGLFPFLSVVPCPTCHNRETYRLGRQRANGVEITSFERGHVVVSPDSQTALASWEPAAP